MHILYWFINIKSSQWTQMVILFFFFGSKACEKVQRKASYLKWICQTRKELRSRYRFIRQTIQRMTDIVRDDITKPTLRSHALSADMQELKTCLITLNILVNTCWKTCTYQKKHIYNFKQRFRLLRTQAHLLVMFYSSLSTYLLIIKKTATLRHLYTEYFKNLFINVEYPKYLPGFTRWKKIYSKWTNPQT